MAQIKKIVRCLNKGDGAEIHVQLDHGGESIVYVSGEVVEIFHMGKSKSYVVAPWSRPKQSRTAVDKPKLYE